MNYRIIAGYVKMIQRQKNESNHSSADKGMLVGQTASQQTDKKIKFVDDKPVLSSSISK